jgi:hypothetical protein
VQMLAEAVGISLHDARDLTVTGGLHCTPSPRFMSAFWKRAIRASYTQ